MSESRPGVLSEPGHVDLRRSQFPDFCAGKLGFSARVWRALFGERVPAHDVDDGDVDLVTERGDPEQVVEDAGGEVAYVVGDFGEPVAVAAGDFDANALQVGAVDVDRARGADLVDAQRCGQGRADDQIADGDAAR